MKTLITTLLTLLLLWSLPPLAQETEDVSAQYNWVEMPDKNPFPPPTITGGFGDSPQLIDFDGDGDFDAFDGIYYYENLGTAKEPKFKTPPTKITEKFFAGAEMEGRFTFVDIDNDNDFDVFLVFHTSNENTLQYYENTGQKNRPVYEERTGTANPLPSAQEVDINSTTTLTFVDIDADQDLDIFFSGHGYLTLTPIWYENIGNSSHPKFEKQTDMASKLAMVMTLDGRLYPNFADSDQDGDLDLFITNHHNGMVYMVYYENTGTAKQPQFEERPNSANPFNEIAQSLLYPIDLVDIDNDNDLDIFEGNYFFPGGAHQPLTYYENTGPIHSPLFVEKALFQEPDTVDIGGWASPKFVDIDNDGDQDAFISDYYYENIGNARSPQFVRRTDTANPLPHLSHSPVFVDFDGDGDWDFIEDNHFYENIGTATHPQFIKKLDRLVDLQESSSQDFSVVDIDHDGDMDLFLNSSRQPIFFENIGNINTPVFAEYSGNANPLNGISLGALQTPVPNFYDMDHDGDWDAVFTVRNIIHYYENTGGSHFPVFEQRTDQNNPFFYIKELSSDEIWPSFVDIDNDGHLEGFIGLRDGTVKYYENSILPPNNNPYVFKKSLDNPFLIPSFFVRLTRSAMGNVQFVNLDNDDKWDMFLSSQYFENIGDSDDPRFIDESISHVIRKINAYDTDSVMVVDLDQDGNLEVLFREIVKKLWYYENVGNTNHPHFEELSTNPFIIDSHTSIGSANSTAFVDIDNDQDLDFFTIKNSMDVRINYFENTGNGNSPIFEERFGTANPFGELNEALNKENTEKINNIRHYYIRDPRFVDIDNDGDWDAFLISMNLGSTAVVQSLYFENTGDINQPQFEERTDTANPLSEIPLIPISLSPAFVDLDLDGDWDVFMGGSDLDYYENTGSVTTPQFVERVDHPLDWVQCRACVPHFGDIDQDGDLDIFIGGRGGTKYYENTGNATHPVFQPPPNNNPLSELLYSRINYNFSSYTFVDIDNDTDQDLFIDVIGDKSVIYVENIGDISSPKFVARTETIFTDVPTFVDIDNDQDFDAFVRYHLDESRETIFRYYENVGQVDRHQFVERIGIANPLDGMTREDSALSVLRFMDLDSDGDLDMIMEERIETHSKNGLVYYENIGQPNNPKFIENNTANPFKNLSPGSYKVLIDLDKDGDIDVLSHNSKGAEYYVNTSAKHNILADNYALPSGGKYNQGREINLGCLDCTKIYYTLDGSQPTAQSTLFTAPFNVIETTTLKFFTVDAQDNASEVITEQYLIDTEPPVFTTTWPVNKQVLLKIDSIEGTVEESESGSGLDRMELQINNGPLYLSGNNNDPFTSSPLWIKFSAASRHQWYYDFGHMLPLGPYTIKARAYDLAGNYSEETFTVIKVELARSDLFLELSSATLLNDATLNAKGNLVSRRYPAIKENLAGLPIELTITAPDGTTETRTTEILSDIGQYEFKELSDFTLEGTYTLQTRFAGNDLLSEAVSSQQTVLVGESAGYAIIIQGKIENEEGLDSHNKTTNRIYQTLKARGFEDANIFYFNTNPDQEGIEIDGEPTVADFVTIEELQNRINGSPAPFYLIMVNHGDPDGNFYINDVDLEYVSPQIWSDWLNALEAGLIDQSKPRIIMLGYCFSGKTLEALSKPGRIIVSSATAKEESYKGPTEPDGIRGGEYFMDDFFKNLGRGESFREAFEKSSTKTRQFTTRGGRFINIENKFGDDAVQHPLIDANGDKKGSNDTKLETPTNPVEIEPLYNLSELFLGAGADYDTNYAGNPADIIKVAETIYLTPEQSATELYLTVSQLHRVKDAAVNVRLPSTELELADTKRTGYAEQREIAELVEINLLCDFSQQCVRDTDEVSPDLFTEPGKYDLFYFVVDNETDNMSPIHRAVVYKNKPGNGSPAEFNLLAPANMAKTATAPTFTWEPSTDPDDDPITYNLVIATDADFNTVVYQTAGIRKTEFALEDATMLEANTTYYWKVEAVDYFGARTESGEVFVLSTE